MKLGLFIEAAKPTINPGHGANAPCEFECSRATSSAVLTDLQIPWAGPCSDAVTLVQSNRFNTVDYTPAALTNWGFTEIDSDLKTLGGSMLYKLIQTALPGWFAYNHVNVMQPFYTKKANMAIATEIGTISLYSTDSPAAPHLPKLVIKNQAARAILKDQTNFKVPFGATMDQLLPGKHSFGLYMLSGDSGVTAAQRNLVDSVLHGSTDFTTVLDKFVMKYGTECLENETLNMGPSLDQIDVIRE
jgi:hypothetical protein